jgi:hypothetical protein
LLTRAADQKLKKITNGKRSNNQRIGSKWHSEEKSYPKVCSS